MRLRNVFRSTIPVLMLLFSGYAMAQNALKGRVQEAHNAGSLFEPLSLFHTTTGDVHGDVINNATLLKRDITVIASVYERKPQAVSLKFTTVTGKVYNIEMLRSNPLAGNANMGIIDMGGRHKCNFDPGLHYQGIVAGSDVSMAAMSIFANGEVMILFANNDGNFVVGKLDDGSGNYMLYNDQDALSRPHMHCAFKENKNFNYSNTSATERTTGVRICHKVQIYWECDYDLYSFKGSDTATRNYLLGLFNQMQTLYANENLAIELKSLYIWTTQDTYLSSIGPSEIFQLNTYWDYAGDSFDGDIAMLLTKDGGGGVSFGGIPICDRTSAFSYAGVDGTYNTVPAYSWDVEVVSHETGHQFGLDHTHNCGWHTGPGGTCGAIDNCATLEDSGSCHAPCPSTDSVGKGTWQGTIMSYCSNVNLALGFGPLPGNFMRNAVTNCSTLKSVIDLTLTPVNICTNDGSVGLAFNTDNLGTTPYTYHWSNGSTTSNIFGLSTAGTYSVTVTDSNNCATTVSANVQKLATPGNGSGPKYQPLCCKDTSFTYTLSASLPTNLLSCQTVAWLRTTSAITSFATAQTAYNSAGALDILSSTNSDSISTSSHAKLNVSSPVPCAAQSYYYTPFISRKLRGAFTSADSTSTILGIVNVSGYKIGNYVSLADLRGTFTTCDPNDTPSSQSLTVIVTGYTGRANNMTIAITSSTGAGLYLLNGLAGNGTYAVPVKATDTLLKGMTIKVFDYNCVKRQDSAVVSTNNIKVVRSVAYAAITKPSFENVCNVGTSALLSFAPTGCVRLDAINLPPIEESMSVYPNPGTDAVTLEFNAHSNGSGVMLLTDVLGRTITTTSLSYSAGNNKIPVDVHGYANGVYFVVVKTGDGNSNKTKFVVGK